MEKTTSANTAQHLRQGIENEIALGYRLPGERLDEQQLAAAFGVSRTPVREALQQLASAGLVEIRPRRGAFIAVPSPERLYQMFELMAELEALAARLASRRITPEGAAELQEAHLACSNQRSDADAYYFANEAFHRVIYWLSGNAFLAEEAMALQTRLKPFRRLQLRVRGRIAASFCEHESIVSAIIAGDGEAAVSAIRAHVQVQGDRFSDLVASLAALKAA